MKHTNLTRLTDDEHQLIRLDEIACIALPALISRNHLTGNNESAEKVVDHAYAYAFAMLAKSEYLIDHFHIIENELESMRAKCLKQDKL